MSKKLEGKVAVVTGASKGIGASIAKALADEGASVVVNYSSSKQGADRVVTEIAGRGGAAIAVQGDVSKQAHIERLFSEAKKAFGRLDILVNNAGVYEFLPLEGVTEDHFHKHFNVNVLGLLLTTKEAVKHMGPEGGSVINIGSGADSMGPAARDRGRRNVRLLGQVHEAAQRGQPRFWRGSRGLHAQSGDAGAPVDGQPFAHHYLGAEEVRLQAQLVRDAGRRPVTLAREPEALDLACRVLVAGAAEGVVVEVVLA